MNYGLALKYASASHHCLCGPDHVQSTGESSRAEQGGAERSKACIAGSRSRASKQNRAGAGAIAEATSCSKSRSKSGVQSVECRAE